MAQAFPITRFIGRALIALARISAVILSVILLILPLRGSEWQALNQGAGSNTLLHILFQPWVSIVLATAMLAYLVARFKLIPRPQTRMTDMLYLAIVVGLLGALQAVAYLPILQAPTI